MNKIDKKFKEKLVDRSFFRKVVSVLIYKYSILKRRLLKKKVPKVKKVNDYLMYLHPEDKGLSLDLALAGIREPLATKEYSKMINKNDVVADIGGNLGYYTILSAKKVKKVYSFEPNKTSFGYLKQSILLNKLKNVEVNNVAISDKGGEIKFYETDELNLSSCEEINTNVKPIKVKTLKLDSFFKNKIRPTILRMDVEGHEDKVLYGAKNILGNVRMIFLETHIIMKKDRMEKMFNFLRKNGFDLHIAIREQDVDSLLLNRTLKKIKQWASSYGRYKINMKDYLKYDIKKTAAEVFFIKKNLKSTLLS